MSIPLESFYRLRVTWKTLIWPSISLIAYRVDLGLVNGKRSFKSFPSREAAEKFRKDHLEKVGALSVTCPSGGCTERWTFFTAFRVTLMEICPS